MTLPNRIVPFMLLFALVGCQARIHGGLDEAEANEIQTLLLESGFQARKVPEQGKKPTWAIEVDEDQATAAVRILTELGLPKKRVGGFDAVETGLVATPAQERVSHLNALSEELEMTLQSISGVTMARVHLVVPPPARPGQTPGQAKASALVRVRPGHGPRVKGMEEELRKVIAGSVEGLSPDDVSLVVNEVVSTVSLPEGGMTQAQRLRYVVIGLGALVSVLALLLVFVALKWRSAQALAAAASAAPPAPARPVVNAAGTKKAA